MAPEQIRQRPVDGRADIYAAGVLLYEMLVGHKPFVHAEMDKLMLLHLEAEPVPPRQLLGPDAISPALEAVILKALAKEPKDRFQSAQEMSDALLAAEAAAPSEAAPARRPTPVRVRSLPRRLFPWLVAAVLFVGLVLVVRQLGH
jgi:serine/threonine-protein kinase